MTSADRHPPSLDGVASPEDYCRAKRRILFVAKEPHGDVEDAYEYLGYAEEE
jgi:hypothetical protein